jgi:hypothetical protein
MATNPKHWVYKGLCPNFLAKKLLIIDLNRLKPKLKRRERGIITEIENQWKALDSISFISLGLFSVIRLSHGFIKDRMTLYFAGLKLMAAYTSVTVLTDYVKVRSNYNQFAQPLNEMHDKYAELLELTELYGLKS